MTTTRDTTRPRIVNLGNAWPFPEVTNGYKTKHPTWFETTQERAEELLNVLPPIYFRGGFFVSEPATHTEKDVPVYTACVRRGARYFLRDVPQTDIEDALCDLADALRRFELRQNADGYWSVVDRQRNDYVLVDSETYGVADGIRASLERGGEGTHEFDEVASVYLSKNP